MANYMDMEQQIIFSANFPNSNSFITGSSSSSSRNIGITIPTANGTPGMESRLWSRLPQVLLDRVIAFLPTPSFFRSRLVCKRWYNLLFSSRFGELSHDVSRRRHWFLFFRGRSYKSQIYKTNDSGHGNDDNDYSEGYLFDPYEKKWYQLTFPFLPPGFSPRSSSSGIVIWVSDKAGPKQFIVANPIAMMFTYLPPTQTSRMCPSIGLVATDSSFYVMVAGEDMPSQFSVKNLTTESFLIDSVANYYFPWDITSALPNLYNSESTRMVFVEGRFYCMNYSPFGIWSYDIATNQWNKIQTPMHRHLRSPSLVECRGRLLLVAAVEKAKLKVQRGMRLWGLQDETWDEVDKMPQQLYEEFEAVENNNGFDCVGHGDFITITILGSDKVLLFDFRHKVWEWVPQCPYVPPYGSGGGELHGFAYEPRLTTPVMNQLAILPPN